MRETASPDVMLEGLRPPVVLYEWQEVPELLGAVKRSVDEDPTPGRYILTGSVRAELENRVWPGTGRLLQVPMFGMSVREVLGRASMRASATVTPSDARHLAWLRDETGSAFAAGIVFHTGPHVFPLGDRIVAAPVSALWSSARAEYGNTT
jgi:AAA domain